MPQATDSPREVVSKETHTKTIHFPSPRHLSQLYADRQENLAHPERVLGVRIVSREDWLQIVAPPGEDGLETWPPARPLPLAEDFFGSLHAARGWGITTRPPDFPRLADSFPRG